MGGNELTPTQAADIPTSASWPVAPESMYTVLMVDPDASSEQPRLHWLVVNIPSCNIMGGMTYMQYDGPHPPADTGDHRYVFLVYHQTSSIEGDLPSTDDERTSFDLNEFVTSNNVHLVAGNYFLSKY